MIHDWCPEWKPRYFMVDKSDTEISAITTLFPECRVYLCDFHREQAWEGWLSLTEHGARNHREEILCRIRRIAAASTHDMYQQSVTDLKNSDVWKNNIKFRNWFGKTWLPDHKKWICAFRDETFNVAVKTNNGVERQNRESKHGYLKDYRDTSLSGLVTILVEQYLPDKYTKYIEAKANFQEDIESIIRWSRNI